jgi:hypothetical protein
MQGLIDQRYPVYAEADLCVTSLEVPHELMVQTVLLSLQDFLERTHPAAPESLA